MIVVDASALVDMLLSSRSATSIKTRLARSSKIHVPVTVDTEVLHALRKQAFSPTFRPEYVGVVLSFLGGRALTRHPVQPLAPRIWSLRQNVTTYDAAYVALAESLNIPLLTRDARPSRSSGHSARIEYIA
jgi:predicted nucleic acid-binding protein